MPLGIKLSLKERNVQKTCEDCGQFAEASVSSTIGAAEFLWNNLQDRALRFLEKSVTQSKNK